jgi:Flp pilus assembly protein TadG
LRTQHKINLFASTLLKDESGAVAIAFTVMFPAFVGIATLAVDASYVFSVHNQLQNAADAAALAGNQYIGTVTTYTNSTPCTGSSASPEASGTSSVCSFAESVAAANMPSATYGSVLKAADIVLGTWSSAGVFTPLATSGTTPPNAVQVTTRMTSANGNPVNLFFTKFLSAVARGAGFSTFSVDAKAVAAFTATNACQGTSCFNGSGFNATSDLIIVQDISSSFSSVLSNAKTAELNCVQDFAASGGPNSSLGLTLFTGNSPQKAVTSINGTAVLSGEQGGWCPQYWKNSCTTGGKDPLTGITTAEEQNPYAALTSATSTNFKTNMDNSVNNEQDCSNSSSPQYGCSGSNIAAGMQAAINQACPSTGCAGGSVQMLIITDGISNCSVSSSSGSVGTSTIAGQNCPAGTGGSGMNSGDGQLLTDAQNLATYAGNLGITVSTLYYSGESGENDGNATGPDGNTHAVELQNLTTLANTALKSTVGSNALLGQFFNEPTGSSLTADMQEICSGGANANRPRLVL